MIGDFALLIDLFIKHDTLRHADLIKALAAQSVIASPERGVAIQ